MKIRTGFVSNSSSSSFIVASNDENVQTTLTGHWDEMFASDNEHTNRFMKNIGPYAVDEIFDGDGFNDSWSNLRDLIHDYERDNYDAMSDTDKKFYEDLFSRWKYVHEITIGDTGDGYGRISTALRRSFPRNYKSDNIEVVLID